MKSLKFTARNKKIAAILLVVGVIVLGFKALQRQELITTCNNKGLVATEMGMKIDEYEKLFLDSMRWDSTKYSSEDSIKFLKLRLQASREQRDYIHENLYSCDWKVQIGTLKFDNDTNKYY